MHGIDDINDPVMLAAALAGKIAGSIAIGDEYPFEPISTGGTGEQADIEPV